MTTRGARATWHGWGNTERAKWAHNYAGTHALCGVRTPQYMSNTLSSPCPRCETATQKLIDAGVIDEEGTRL